MGLCVYIYVDYMIRFHFLNHGIMTILYYGIVWFMAIYNRISPSTNDDDIWCFMYFIGITWETHGIIGIR